MDEKRVYRELLLRLDKQIVKGKDDHRRLMAMARANGLLPAELVSKRFLDICEIMEKKGKLSRKNLRFLMDVFPKNGNSYAFKDICRTRNRLAGTIRAKITSPDLPQKIAKEILTGLMQQFNDELRDIRNSPEGTRKKIELRKESVSSIGEAFSLCKNMIDTLYKIGTETEEMTSGSLCLPFTFHSKNALNTLWDMYLSGELLRILQEGLVTPFILKKCEVESFKLEVYISEEEYEECLLHLDDSGNVHKECNVVAEEGIEEGRTNLEHLDLKKS